MKIKFCGLTNLESLKQACALDAHFAGFIFAEQSSRKVELSFIKQLAGFDFRQTMPVCVFVNPSIQEVHQAIEILPNTILQFHGDESDSFCSQFNQPFWKSIPVKNTQSLYMSNNFPSAQGINYTNLQSAISLNPWCIDINSGVESGLGIKDSSLMTEIMTAFNHG
jgi:phosphoribosylanthranilate isomerase